MDQLLFRVAVLWIDIVLRLPLQVVRAGHDPRWAGFFGKGIEEPGGVDQLVRLIGISGAGVGME